MRLYPAIDICNGQCVRLRQGQFHDAEVYSHSPLKIAKLWEASGASYIHIVDLDGALAGHSMNEEVIKGIVANVEIPVQTGGGIRTLKDIETKLSLGVSRVIIGTKAVEDPKFVKEAVSLFGPEKIVVGIDAKQGMVAIHGWEQVSDYKAVTLALQMKEYGVQTIVYTDISRDGMLQGPNIEQTAEMVHATGLSVIASGGVSSMKDLEAVSQIPVAGAIVGKALYENKLNLRNAIEQFEKNE